MKITQDMVGLKFSVVSHVESDFDSHIVKIKFEDISDEGLALFGIEENQDE